MVDPRFALGVAALIGVLAVLLFWPGRGFVWRGWRPGTGGEKERVEDVLKHMAKCEMKGRTPTLAAVAGVLQAGEDVAARLLAQMEARGLLAREHGELRLTDEGRAMALQVIRAHRLWERYLADQTGFRESEWHERAERQEHRLGPEELAALSARLGNPTHDPHGDPIPDSTGEFVQHGGEPLPALPPGRAARIVHLEDEPEAVYSQLVAEGLYPGMDLRLAEVTPRRVRFWAGGEEHVLAPVVASNISVKAIPEEGPTEPGVGEESWEGLDALHPGEEGKVIEISPRCRGQERDRLMDLGILPGTVIRAEMASPGGDPVAYRIRDALIALRDEQARMIRIARVPGGSS